MNLLVSCTSLNSQDCCYRSKPGATALDDFEVLSTIGTGSYGTCKKIKRKKDGKVSYIDSCYTNS